MVRALGEGRRNSRPYSKSTEKGWPAADAETPRVCLAKPLSSGNNHREASAEKLGLAEGKEACAVIKASNVMIGVE